MLNYYQKKQCIVQFILHMATARSHSATSASAVAAWNCDSVEYVYVKYRCTYKFSLKFKALKIHFTHGTQKT